MKENGNALANESLEEVTRRSVLLSRVQDLIAWGRKNSMWPFNFGLSCCYVEMATALTSKYDIARFGAEVIRASPREADVMVVAGTVFIKMAPVIQRLYDQMMAPRWVISMGACANSGGMYDIYSVVQGVDKFLPVDVYVPGCPPRPDALMEGVLRLRDMVGREKRPLSWVVGEQRVYRPELPSMRDLKRDERQRQTVLESPDVVSAGGRGELKAGEVATLTDPGTGTVPEPAGGTPALHGEFLAAIGAGVLQEQITADGIPTFWCSRDRVRDVLGVLKNQVQRPFRMLYDLTGMDERLRQHRDGLPPSDFTVIYHLRSFDRNQDIRIKVPLRGNEVSVDTVTQLWPAANWYERELWDMLGIGVDGHPNLRRILLPPTWRGHPLRKDSAARATENEPFHLSQTRLEREEKALQVRPEEWGLERGNEDHGFMILNLGPQHPGTHGPFRIVLQLDGERIVNAVPDIGFHHRGAEKMGERQSWHTYIPYTDRVDYLSGVLNNLPYVMAVEQLAGIEVPDRVKVIRVMLCELFRIISHLVYYGTFGGDVGALSPVFYMFTDREKAFEIIEAICGFRMHPAWFRIGGLAQDLPQGWDRMVRDFLDYLPPRLKDYDKMVLNNRMFKSRTKGVGAYTAAEAIEWGVTGPALRACGVDWDLRKKRPYSGYERFEFDVPLAHNGDCYDRLVVHVEEMRQSLRIIRQCLDNMPEGPYKSDHPLTTPPRKERTMHDIETLIHHFINESWGPVIPAGEAAATIESSKGNYTYYLTSDKAPWSYRTRIRTPSFAHLQMIPLMSRGRDIADLLAILGSIDFVLADVDR